MRWCKSIRFFRLHHMCDSVLSNTAFKHKSRAFTVLHVHVKCKFWVRIALHFFVQELFEYNYIFIAMEFLPILDQNKLF